MFGEGIMNKGKYDERYEMTPKEVHPQRLTLDILKREKIKKPEPIASAINAAYTSEKYKEENKRLKGTKKSPLDFVLEALAMGVGALFGAFITTLNLICLAIVIVLSIIRGILGFKYGK